MNSCNQFKLSNTIELDHDHLGGLWLNNCQKSSQCKITKKKYISSSFEKWCGVLYYLYIFLPKLEPLPEK